MEQFTKYYGSYSQYGTTTTFSSVGRTLEVFFLEDQRDAWIAEDQPVDGESYREAATLRQASAILRKTDFYTVHEPDGTTWQVSEKDIVDPDVELGSTLFDLESKQMTLDEQIQIEQKKQEEREAAEND
ncbi:MAG: hypothetical protein ACOYCB_08435 [Fastidiosipilaceae bacterium]|jgi:hypothetical protein|nr:hypothetical protein [Clostridiaceae bacterium]